MFFSLRRPSEKQLRNFFEAQRRQPLSYRAVGATRDRPPSGFRIDHSRVKLGAGRETFEAAKEAIRRWRMCPGELVRPFCLAAGAARVPGIETGMPVVLLARTAGLWSLHACRIVYAIDEAGAVERFGFAYGTLAAHIASGEKRFLIEWRHDDDSVVYDMLAFSRPQGFFGRLALPAIRHFQRLFAVRSIEEMLRATGCVRGGEREPALCVR